MKSTREPRKPSPSGYTIGRHAFAKISAVEGIRITSAMDRDFREFDRQDIPAEERRRVISRKYGRVGPS